MTGADSESSATIPSSEPGDKHVLFWNRAAWNGVEWENDAEFHPLRAQKTGGYCADIIGPEFAFAREMQSKGGLARLAIGMRRDKAVEYLMSRATIQGV